MVRILYGNNIACDYVLILYRDNIMSEYHHMHPQSYLVVQDAEAQPGLSLLQLHHVDVSLPHGQRGRHPGHPPLGDVLRRWTGEDTPVLQLWYTHNKHSRKEGHRVIKSIAHLHIFHKFYGISGLFIKIYIIYIYGIVSLYLV